MSDRGRASQLVAEEVVLVEDVQHETKTAVHGKHGFFLDLLSGTIFGGRADGEMRAAATAAGGAWELLLVVLRRPCLFKEVDALGHDARTFLAAVLQRVQTVVALRKKSQTWRAGGARRGREVWAWHKPQKIECMRLRD